MGEFAGAVARDRGFYEVIHGSVEYIPVAIEAKQRLLGALAKLLERAQAAGVVRPDVIVDDLGALCMVSARLPAWRLEAQPELWKRYLGLTLDGLRPEGAHSLPHAPPAPLPELAAGTRDAVAGQTAQRRR